MFKSKEFKYFKKKLQNVKYAILDQEFKRFKTLEIREEIRQNYDNIKSRIILLQEQYDKEKEKNELPKEDLEAIKDKITKSEAERDRLEQQIKGLDREVYGAKPTAEEPDGFDGIEQVLESLRELVDMIRDYMKKL